MNHLRIESRWSQFGLRVVFVCILGLSLIVGWFANRLHRANNQRDAIRVIESIEPEGSTHIEYEYEIDKLGRYDPKGRPQMPDWAIQWLGEDFFYDVVNVTITLGVNSAPLSETILSNIGRLKSLRALHIDNCNLSEQFLVKHLQHLPALSHLNIEHGQVQDLSLEYVSRLTTLEALFLPNNIANGNLSNLRRLTRLQQLYISGLDHPDLSFLADLSKLQRLEINGISTHSNQLAHLSSLSNLTFLAVAGEIDGPWLGHIAKMQRLESLHLFGPVISDNDLRLLSNLKNLKSLELPHTSVDNEDLMHITDLKHLKSLWLAEGHIGQHSITDDGLAYIGQITSLESLRLHNTGVTDSGLHHLRNLRNLEWLDVSGTQVTKAGIRIVEEWLPGVDARID